MELPEIQKLIEAYAKDKKDVVIVALSQDDDPKELAEVRKLVEKTLDEKKIKLTGTPVGLIGLDPSNSVGEAFQVEAYPTVVLLDAQGRRPGGPRRHPRRRRQRGGPRPGQGHRHPARGQVALRPRPPRKPPRPTPDKTKK